MHETRRLFIGATAAAAIVAAFAVAGPGLAKGGGGSKGGSSGGAAAKTPPKADNKTVLEEIEADSSLTKLTAALKAADLESTLKGAGPFTVLAPNDAAFDKLDKAKLEGLMKPDAKAQLKALLEGHVISSKSTQAGIGKAAKLAGMGGASHAVKVGDDKSVTIDGAKIVKPDVAASNGVVQVIDTVLLPAK